MELTSSTGLRSESGRLTERTLLSQRRIAHPPELRELIMEMGRSNPRWGCVRIRGELFKHPLRTESG